MCEPNLGQNGLILSFNAVEKTCNSQHLFEDEKKKEKKKEMNKIQIWYDQKICRPQVKPIKQRNVDQI